MVGICKITVAALFNKLAVRRSYGNIHSFDRNYQPGKMTLQVSTLIIKYLVVASSG